MQFRSSLLVLAAALLGVLAATGDVIAGSYIVMLKPETPDAEFRAHTSWAAGVCSGVAKNGGSSTVGETLAHTYLFGTMKGYAGAFDNKTIEDIAARPEVAYVEPDRVVGTAAKIVTQAAAGPGLGRISHRQPSNDYLFSDAADGCSGMTAYIIDTGILTTHDQFEGRAVQAITFAGGANADGNGHGTHVAGVVGGRDYGVCKKINLVGVKVLTDEGLGTISSVIAGVQFAASAASADARRGRSVANMSLTGLASRALNAAVNNAILSGLPIAVAAGNFNSNAAGYSPASVPNALTVGAIDPRNDVRAQFSNFGSVVDIFAPGVNIISAYIGNDTTATAILSGTSMATPFVTGVAAYFMALLGELTPTELANTIIGFSLKDMIVSPDRRSPNRIVYNNAEGST